MSAPRTFGYLSEDYDDRGWGCVYRSVQNVQSFLNMPVTPMKELLEAAGRRPRQWAEPAHFVAESKSLFPGATMVQAVMFGHNDQCFKHTFKTQYGTKVAPPSPGFTDAFVVDDGISGYAIVPFEGLLYWADPHVGPSPRLVPYTKQLQSRTGWMVLQVRVRNMR